MNPITFPLKPQMQGAEVANLQVALRLLLDNKSVLIQDEPGRKQFAVLLERDAAHSTFSDATQKLVGLFQGVRGLKVTGEVDEPTAKAFNAALRELGVLDPAEKASDVPKPPPDPGKPDTGVSPVIPNVSVPPRRIEGQILLEHGLPADGVALQLFRRDFGGKLTSLDTKTTSADGQYAFSYASDGKAASLEVWAVVNDKKKVLLTRPLDDLGEEVRTGLNLIAPKEIKPLDAEYARLTGDLKPHVGTIDQLAAAKENDDRQDLTVLNRATGWDARLIALAATTERLSTDSDVKGARLSKDAVYGLLRAGLPSDKLLLAQVPPDVAERAVRNVRDAGIVALTDAQIGQFKSDFATFANNVKLAMPAPGSRSTYGSLLTASGLVDKAQQTNFATIYFNHRGEPAALWDEAAKAGIKPPQIRKLQLQGKLAFLAGNSEAMTTRLLEKAIDDPAQLVEQDFHKQATWLKEIFDQAKIPENRRKNLNDADKAALEPLIPAVYTGATTESRLEAYADDMARKVRISYPTQVVARMIEKEELKVPAAKDPTARLLKSAGAQGFRLGQTPVETFFRTHTGVTAGLTAADRDAAKEQLQTLHRVYQVTPGHEPMAVLLNMKMTSAYDITALSEEEFDRLYEREYFEFQGRKPKSTESRLIYRKAGQVSSVAYNLFTIANKIESEPAVAGLSAPVDVRDSVRNELIRQFPTLESLFGSMDFCECEHCRTVLSPAAYLVDLLQFLEPESWTNFLADWLAKHGTAYPHSTPYDALIARRPDLPHIPLTCENTHTALPYIDIVNEILEYYVAKGTLDKDAARDTGDADSGELLAEPQNVIRDAYDDDHLRGARYPLNLPFDLWIETVRQFSDAFETPLARLLDVFRPTGDLFDATKPFDRSSVFFESLGLSPAEVAIVTDPDPLSNDKWLGLYGLPAARPAIRNPTNVQNATLAIPDADARLFREGMVCTYFDTSANASSAESRTISVIGAAGSGGAGQTVITFSGIWTLAPPVAGDLLVCDAIAILQSAKTLARRLDVTYKEIAAIVRTAFINPRLSKLTVLEKLGVSIHDASFYLQHKDLVGQPPAPHDDLEAQREAEAFHARLAAFAQSFPITVAQLEAALQAIPFSEILVLADPDAGCDFDRTLVRKADGTKGDPIVFLRINLFVRLWRKLGWTIEETDRALSAFVPANAPFETANLAKQPLRTALIYMAHLQELNGKVHAGKQSRMTLPALWSDIPITGARSLYAQLFLTRSVLKTSPVFDHPLGDYLSAAGVKVKDHLLALQGALGLTADDAGRILIDAGNAPDADLTLANVSILYRYGMLARAVNLPVRDLIALRQLSGLDPFRPLHPDPLADTGAGVVPAKKALDFDHPFTQTLRFVDVANEVKDSGLTIEDLDYLLRHRFDGTGKYHQDADGTMALLKTLAEGIRAIRAGNAMPDDANALTEEALRQKLGLALKPDVVETLLGMVNGTVELSATESRVGTADQLTSGVFADEPRIRQLHYSEVRKEQALTVMGVLFDAQRAEMTARFDAALTVPQRRSFANLLNAIAKQAREFFDNHLRKQKLRLDDEAGFLDDADFARLFSPLKPLQKIPATDDQAAIDAKAKENDKVQSENLTTLQQRRVRIAQAFLPFLQRLLIRQFIVQTLTAQTGAEPALIESLLTDERLLSASGPLLSTFTGTGERGVSADFFASDDESGDRQPTGAAVADADTALKATKDLAGNDLGTAKSARFLGYLEVPAAGAYRFSVEVEQPGAAAELRFDHLAEPLFWADAAPPDRGAVLGEKPEQFLELKPGVPYRFTLDLKKLNGGRARLFVLGETLPRAPLSQLAVYPALTVDAAKRADLLLSKAVQLVQSLGLNEREARYLLTHPAAFGSTSLRTLPTRSADDTPARAKALFDQFLRLAAYTRLKRDLAGGTDDLIEIFEANGTTAVNRLQADVYPLIARLTRREKTLIQATATELFAAPSFDSERPLQRLWEVLQIVERFGVPVSSLKQWMRIVSPPATADEHFAIARDLREAIKARFEPEAWQRVAQPIFDRLRQRQRDALVSHVMHQRGFASIDQLYEYFLIDPGMEPVVQTSRIRLAIASVQLFIQRCLLNMELQVSPAAVNARQWEWMKRYRVWEANRKIFVFPENWLEPEFRDDKTHLFTELEGALLQSDVSSDLVEDAFLQYLKKLEELARLDIAAMHLEDTADAATRTLHVIGRTFSQPHKYFYRRYAREMWTPWEPVSAEIEGDHLAPVVWRDRLYLFWITFMDKPAGPQGGSNFALVGIETIGIGTKVLSAPLGAKTSRAPAKKLAEMTANEAVTGLSSFVATKRVEVQLHWSEYVQGEWSTRESGVVSTPVYADVDSSFDPRDVFVHVSKDYELDEERGVRIHLGSPISWAFYLAGRNSAPDSVAPGRRPANPFTSASQDDANRYAGSGAFKVSFQERITTEPGQTPHKANPSILQHQGGPYTVLPCNSDLTSIAIGKDASEDAANPAAVKAALEKGIGEIASLMKPVFYQDGTNTFFVEPSVTEQTIEEWQDWVTRTPLPEPTWHIPEIIDIRPEIPRKFTIQDPRDPGPLVIDPGSVLGPQPGFDWLVNPGTALLFDGTPVGPAGRPGATILTEALGTADRVQVKVNPGGGVAAGSNIVLTGGTTLEQSGLTDVSGGLNVVGSAGFSPALEKNFRDLNRSALGAATVGALRGVR